MTRKALSAIALLLLTTIGFAGSYLPFPVDQFNGYVFPFLLATDTVAISAVQEAEQAATDADTIADDWIALDAAVLSRLQNGAVPGEMTLEDLIVELARIEGVHASKDIEGRLDAAKAKVIDLRCRTNFLEVELAQHAAERYVRIWNMAGDPRGANPTKADLDAQWLVHAPGTTPPTWELPFAFRQSTNTGN